MVDNICALQQSEEVLIGGEHTVQIRLFRDGGRTERRGLRRQVLAEALGVLPDAIMFEREAHGRPVVAGNLRGAISFNESHSGGWYAIALCRTARVGIDIEVMSAGAGLGLCRKDICGNCFGGAATADDETDLLRQWVRREAILKAWGVGVAYNHAQLKLTPSDECCKDVAVTIGDLQLVLSDLALGHDLMAALALWIESVSVVGSCGLFAFIIWFNGGTGVIAECCWCCNAV